MFVLLLTFLLISPTLVVKSTHVECHSCFISCKTYKDSTLDPSLCDCQSDNGTIDASHNVTTCVGSHCFVKVEFFPDESISIVQKGCVQGLPQGVEGCHYAGQLESVHCNCQGHLCNNREELNSYSPQTLPTVECCECSKPGGDICPEDTCLRSCTGNYCLTDFDGEEQGCGMGLPRLQNFLRTPNYLEILQNESTCARYEATKMTSVHGCICTTSSGECNQLNNSRSYQIERVISRRVDDQNYCYSLHQTSDRPFDKDIFRIGDTCEGHYCFISLSTSEIVIEVRNASEQQSDIIQPSAVYTGVVRPKYKLLAGCLKVDDDEKVGVGCTWEYSSKETILSKHCICDSHLCNYFDKLEEDKFIDLHVANALSSSVLHDETEPGTSVASTLICFSIYFCAFYCLFMHII